jgi:hypothetical protein
MSTQTGCATRPAVPGTRRGILGRRSVLGPITTLMVAAGAALATAVAGGVSPAAASTDHRAATGTHNWIATGWNIHLANQIDPANTGHFFNTANSFGTSPKSSVNPVTDGFAANAVLVYDSYAQFASDIRNHAISSSYKWVLYDPEEWSQTPTAEQLDPAKYLRQFGQLAHANGFKVIEAPGRDLGNVAGPGSSCPELPGESLDAWYIRCNIAGIAAASSDVYVLQDQVNTANLAEYDSLFASARRQALAANPQIVVDTELSTNYGTASQMAAAAKSVSADGYFLTITSPAIRQADQFLRLMRTAGF